MKTDNELLRQCDKLFSSCSYHEVIDTCNELLKTSPDHEIAMSYKARSLHMLDRNAEALELLNHALELYPKNHHYLETKAEILMENEDYDEAIRCFEKIFEIGVRDETQMKFIELSYAACCSLKTDYLIEKEKYTDAFEVYAKANSDGQSRRDLIDSFKKYVKMYTTRVKSMKYNVIVPSARLKEELIEFLDENGFATDCGDGDIFLIDVVEKTCNSIEQPTDDAISLSKFYDKVNYYPRGEIIQKKIFSPDNELVYEGYVRNGRPYGFGTAYFPNGGKYREGIFDVKGIVQGKEYYPSGQLRFEGTWTITRGYGPNAPLFGNAYSEDGDLIFSGKFEIKRGGVGWPMIKNPKGYTIEQKERPKIEYYRGG